MLGLYCIWIVPYDCKRLYNQKRLSPLKRKSFSYGCVISKHWRWCWWWGGGGGGGAVHYRRNTPGISIAISVSFMVLFFRSPPMIHQSQYIPMREIKERPPPLLLLLLFLLLLRSLFLVLLPLLPPLPPTSMVKWSMRALARILLFG